MSQKFMPAPHAQKICRRRTLVYKPNDSTYEYLRANGVWQPIHPAYIERIAMQLLGNQAKSAWVADIRKLVERNSLMPPGQDFNEDDGFINLKNGMIFIRARTLLPHDKCFYSTIQLKISYDPAAKCPRWEQFLVEVFEGDLERIALIQEFMGYSLVPDTRYEKALLMIGEGANGKSTLLKVWEQLLGSENVSSVTLPNLQDQFHRVTIHRKLLNIAAELNSMTLRAASRAN